MRHNCLFNTLIARAMAIFRAFTWENIKQYIVFLHVFKVIFFNINTVDTLFYFINDNQVSVDISSYIGMINSGYLCTIPNITNSFYSFKYGTCDIYEFYGSKMQIDIYMCCQPFV